MTETPKLTLTEARAFVRRAIEKAEDLGQRASYVLVDPNGILVTASRMDGAVSMSYRISRAKAYNTALYGMSNGMMYDFSVNGPPILIQEIMNIAREPIFHGAGSQVIRRDGRVIGAMTTGMGVPPMVQLPGVDPEKLILNGKPTNAEDMCMAYALRIPYSPEHGDDAAAWVRAYGKLPETQGTAADEAPAATRQPQLDAALRLSDAAQAEAARRNARIAVVIVDQSGEVVQLDRMDGASAITHDVAEAVAATAAHFQAPSSAAASYPDLQGLSRITSQKLLGVAGGLPIVRDGLVTGAIGIGGADPKLCEEIAQAALNA